MRKLFTTQQIRNWDQFTIKNEPIASIDLMERAAERCFSVLDTLLDEDEPVIVVCGTGNNGGDGLALARMLRRTERETSVFILGDPAQGTADMQVNHLRLEGEDVTVIKSDAELHLFDPEALRAEAVVVDAIFGSGLTRKVEGWRAAIVKRINAMPNQVVSIDIPTGLMGDGANEKDGSLLPAVKADLTLTFQQPKNAFFYPHGAAHAGEIIVLDIGLSESYHDQTETDRYYVEEASVAAMFEARKVFSHKGSHGMAQIVGGSKHMQGAPLLATGAALRSGTGLVAVYVPAKGVDLVHQMHPEALVEGDASPDRLTRLTIHRKATALGIGMGMGTAAESLNSVKAALASDLPVVLDADGLNLLAIHKDPSMLVREPATIITPHPGEFDRLFGGHANLEAREATAVKKAAELGCIIILKGAYTRIVAPDGRIYVNTSGSPALAVGGSGDVLTGILTGLLAQGMDALDASVAGVYIHGMCGDIYEEEFGTRGLKAGDLYEMLPEVWQALRDCFD